MLFSSHTNSLSAHLNLLDQTECRYLITSSNTVVSDILAQRDMKHVIAPELSELLAETTIRHFPFTKTFPEAQHDPFLILHTSGSTGLPKPVTFTHAVVAAQDAHSAIEPFADEEAQRLGWQRQNWTHLMHGRFTSPFAPFHVIMALPVLMYTVFGSSTYVYASRQTLPDTSAVMLAAESCDTAWLSPSILESIAANSLWLHIIGKLQHVVYGGGALVNGVGDRISQYTRLINKFGTTELGGLLLSGQVAPHDWEYILFDPQLNGIEWRANSSFSARDGNQPYKMVIVADREIAFLQSVFKVFPQENEYATGDLWTKHPRKANLWRYAGRVDDLICFNHGIKFHPKGVEDKLKENAFIDEALMFGDKHEQPVLLVELSGQALALIEDEKQQSVYHSVEDLIEQMNQELPSIARIKKTHVVYASGGKRFSRATKGTVMRFHTFLIFKEDIDHCYAEHGDTAAKMLERLEHDG